MLAVLDIKAIRSVIGVDGAAISADVTAFAEDMQTDWMTMEMIINGQNDDANGVNNNIGWQSLGGLDIVRDGVAQTLIWEVPADLSTKIAGTDDTIALFELFIIANNGATNTKIYIDNIQMLGAEPEPELSTKIVYVDATEGEAGNTLLATGETFTSTEDGSGSDNLWRGRVFANSGTIFESGGQYGDTANPEDCPRLMTLVDVPENDYEVYVYFWADTSTWRIQASLTDSEGDLPLFLANDPNYESTMAVADDFAEPVPMLTEGNRTLWQAYLGTTGLTTMISVYIDDDAATITHNARTWYDGIGYKVASELEPAPEPAPEPVDPGIDGLVAYYALENDVNDSSGNGLDGIIVGDPAFVDGVAGMALDFNGDDYVDCGTNDVLNNLSDAMTVSAWVNIRSVTTAWMGIVMKGETAWRLGVNNESTGVHFGFTGDARGWQAANSITELPLNEWHHIAGTYDRSVGATVHVDGVAETVNPNPDGVATNEISLLLGNNPEEPDRLFDGMLDEVLIYNRALSEEEILYLAVQ